METYSFGYQWLPLTMLHYNQPQTGESFGCLQYLTSSLQRIFFDKPVIRQARDMEALLITIRNTYMTYTDPHFHNPSSNYPFPRDFIETSLKWQEALFSFVQAFHPAHAPTDTLGFHHQGLCLQLSPGYARIFWEQSIQECTLVIWANHHCRLWSYEAEITGLSWLVYKVFI